MANTISLHRWAVDRKKIFFRRVKHHLAVGHIKSIANKRKTIISSAVSIHLATYFDSIPFRQEMCCFGRLRSVKIATIENHHKTKITTKRRAST